MNNETILKLIIKNLNEGLTKKEIKKIPYLSKDKIPEADFEVCFVIAKKKIQLEKGKIRRKESQKDYHLVTLQITLDLWNKLQKYEYEVYINKTKPQIYVLDLIEEIIELKFSEGLKTSTKY